MVDPSPFAQQRNDAVVTDKLNFLEISVINQHVSRSLIGGCVNK
jgi:hypothetical protein